MEFTPNTDREIYLSLNNEVQKLRETIERFGAALLNLENNKFTNHEIRIEVLERIETERKGVWKFIVAVGVFMGVVLTILTIKTFMK